ncbi:MAG: hypothetical protein AMS16_03650 [Planctomycetes bacterium DG_58]|nr:MAG: hypothetical protein AMS16_03650 [Planctomycetes bacterium DG_58]
MMAYRLTRSLVLFMLTVALIARSGAEEKPVQTPAQGGWLHYRFVEHPKTGEVLVWDANKPETRPTITITIPLDEWSRVAFRRHPRWWGVAGATSPDWIDALCLTKDALWLGSSGGGVWRRDTRTGRWEGHVSRFPDKIYSFLVREIFQHGNAIWVLTRGPHRYDLTEKTWQHYQDRGDAAFAASGRRLALISWRQGPRLFEPKQDKFVPVAATRPLQFSGPLAIHDDTLWCTCWTENKERKHGQPRFVQTGLARWDLKSRHLTTITKEQAPVLSAAERSMNAGNRWIAALFCTKEAVWIGTEWAGLFRYRVSDGRVDHWPLKNRRGFLSCVKRIVPADGRLYLVPCERKGCGASDTQSETLMVLNLKTDLVEHIKLPEPRAVTAVACHGGWVWVGTTSGLLLLDAQNDKWVPLPVSCGTVRCIVADDTQVWVGSNNGVFGWLKR